MAIDREYWRNKKREQRQLDKESAELDKMREANPKAFELACERAERARLYALKFPHMVLPGEERFATVAWQYVNEGLKRYPDGRAT